MLGFLVKILKRLAKKGFVILRDKQKFRKRFNTAKKRGTTLKKCLIFIDMHVNYDVINYRAKTHHNSTKTHSRRDDHKKKF